MLWRLLRSMMTSEAVKKVPIPPRGVDYRGKIVLAPMVRSGELPNRLLALHYGADLVWGPETVDQSLIGTTRRFNERTQTVEFSRMPSNPMIYGPAKENVIYRIHPKLEGPRLIFQLGTSNPERAVAAARLVAADVAGIDVNAGCPKPFSTSGGMGAALLKTPDLLCSILEALVHSIVPEFGIGISVKIRILSNPVDTEALVRRLVATGITALTVHCRTTPMRPRERAIRDQLRMICEICHDAGVACVMNGDVKSRDQGLELMKEYGVDGAMIATAAERNASCFRSVADGGLANWREVVSQYLRYCLLVGNRYNNTKFELAQMVPGKQSETLAVTRSHRYVETIAAMGLDDLKEQAFETDQILGIDPEAAEEAALAKETAKRERRRLLKEEREKVAQEQKETNSEIKDNKDATDAKENGSSKKPNAVALAASGNMAQARTSESQRKPLSERGVTASSSAPDAAATHTRPAAEVAAI